MVASAAWERREEAGTRPAARGCEPGGEGRVCLVSLLPDSDPAGGRVAEKKEWRFVLNQVSQLKPQTIDHCLSLSCMTFHSSYR